MRGSRPLRIITEKMARGRVSIFRIVVVTSGLCVCVCVCDGRMAIQSCEHELWLISGTYSLIHIDITILITEWHLLRKHIIIYHILFVFRGYLSMVFVSTFTAHDIHRKCGADDDKPHLIMQCVHHRITFMWQRFNSTISESWSLFINGFVCVCAASKNS